MKSKRGLVSPFVEIEIVGLDCDNSKYKTVTIRKYIFFNLFIFTCCVSSCLIGTGLLLCPLRRSGDMLFCKCRSVGQSIGRLFGRLVVP